MRRLSLPGALLLASAFSTSCGSNSKTVPIQSYPPLDPERLVSRLSTPSTRFGPETESAQQLRERCQAGRPTVQNNWNEVRCILSSDNPGRLDFSYRGGRAERTLHVSEYMQDGETMQTVVCDRDVISVVTNRSILLFCGAEDLFAGKQEVPSFVDFDDANFVAGKLVGDTLYGVFDDGKFHRIVLTKDDGYIESRIPIPLSSKDLEGAQVFANPALDLFLILFPNSDSKTMGALLISLDDEGNYEMQGGSVPIPMLYLTDAVPLPKGFRVKGELPPIGRPFEKDIVF